jgi:hypothetical protein
MALVVNLLVALGFAWLTRYVLAQMKVGDPVNIIVAVLIGLVVFFANPAAYLL